MDKVSVGISNNFCPQALFLYGTNREDGSPNFGTFCWFSYCWDSQMHVMACIGGNKLTKDRIHKEKIFSANLVTESMIPTALYLGEKDGYQPDKMDISIGVERGAVLDVPVLKDSPWVFELEVKQSIPMDDGEIFICKIRNVLAAAELTDNSLTAEERMKLANPAIWASCGNGKFFSLKPIALKER